MKLKITIAMENDAFYNSEGAECARILRYLAENLQHQPELDTGVIAKLSDLNGNNVGEAKVTR